MEGKVDDNHPSQVIWKQLQYVLGDSDEGIPGFGSGLSGGGGGTDGPVAPPPPPPIPGGPELHDAPNIPNVPNAERRDA